MPNFVQWEVRTTGSDTNGGGFKLAGTGTDYSQQNAAQFSGTDLASTSGTTIPCIVTSATHTFVAADVDNIIQVSAGTNWTAGFYPIVSVAGNAATLDRACGSSATITGGTWAEGGALLTISEAFTAVSFGDAQQSTVWLKSGTYTVTSSLTMPSSSTFQNSNVILHGYQTTHGDNTGTRPLITSATNSVALLTGNIPAFANTTFTVDNVSLSHTAGTRGACIVASSSGNAPTLLVYNSVLNGCSTGILGPLVGIYSFEGLVVHNSEIKNCTADGIQNVGNTYVLGSYIHDNVGRGLHFAGNQGSFSVFISVESSVIANNTLEGIRATPEAPNGHGVLAVKNSVLYGNGRTGLIYSGSGDGSGASLVLTNNIFEGNGSDISGPYYGLAFSSSDEGLLGPLLRLNNAFYNNTAGETLNLPVEPTDITLTASAFVSAGTNYQLNSTAGGGAVLKAAGFPGVGATGTGYLDIGALQSIGVVTVVGGSSAYVQ